MQRAVSVFIYGADGSCVCVFNPQNIAQFLWTSQWTAEAENTKRLNIWFFSNEIIDEWILTGAQAKRKS